VRPQAEIEHALRAATEGNGPPPSRDAELVQEPAGLGGQELRLVPHALELGRAVPQVVVVGWLTPWSPLRDRAAGPSAPRGRAATLSLIYVLESTTNEPGGLNNPKGF
jgi:hypothetical protein